MSDQATNRITPPVTGRDQLSHLLEGYRHLATSDFNLEAIQWASIVWVGMAQKILDPKHREEIQGDERLDILVSAMGEILVKLNIGVGNEPPQTGEPVAD